jgi:segregation and condensation protein B
MAHQLASLAETHVDDVEDQSVTEPQDAPPATRPEELRLLEALLFASAEPLEQSALAKRMPEGTDIKAALAQLQADYAMRGVNLVRVASKWTFRTAGDLAWLMTRETTETRKLSRAAIEVLAIVAYHQPVTRAEIEDIRGVVTSKGTLDVLLETGWIRPRGRRKTPGRPLTFGTTDSFLAQFSLEALGDLPGLEELKGTGLLDSRLPAGFSVPNPSDDPQLREDEDPLEDAELHLALSAPDPEFPEVQALATDASVAGSGPDAEPFAEARAELAAAYDASTPSTGDSDVIGAETTDIEAEEAEEVAAAEQEIAGDGDAAADADAEEVETAAAAPDEPDDDEAGDDNAGDDETVDDEDIDEDERDDADDVDEDEADDEADEDEGKSKD